MGSVSERVKVIPEGLNVNPSCFGWFSNIFNIWESVLALQGNIHDDILFQLSQLFSTSWKVFAGRPRLFPMVQMTTLVTLASSQIFSLIMHACNVILIQIVHHICFIHHGKCFQVDQGYL
jgi:hypothetical protein